MAARVAQCKCNHGLTVPNNGGDKDSALSLRRVSAPHIPLMVVVTDVDGGKSDGLEDGAVSTLAHNHDDDAHHRSTIYSRLTKGLLKSDASGVGGGGGTGDFPMNVVPSSSSGANNMSKKGQQENNKPLTKWRRICKCFIGLKVGKKHKNASSHHQQKANVSSAEDKGHSLAVATRDRSQSLYPGVDPDLSSRLSVSSVSPARSNHSIRSRLSSKSETDFYLFDMGNMSEILTLADIKMLGKSFPPQAVGCPCILTFSTAQDGYSLHSLYRKMENIDSPMILAVLDTEGRAFGAVLSCALRVSEHFYGSYDSFLFRCGPPLEVFKWQPGSNFYFIHSEEKFLRIGAGRGNCGLWLDDNLFHGRTEDCATFNSPPLVIPEDFEVAAVECWTFGQGC